MESTRKRRGHFSVNLTDEVHLPTFDQCRLPIYEQPRTFERILKYVTGNGTTKEVVFPEHMLQMREANILVSLLNCDKSFVLLGRSIASTMNISTGLQRPPQVLFDACIISIDRPSFLLSFVNGPSSDHVLLYNTAVARGVVTAVRTYSATSFAVLHGTISNEDVSSSATFAKALQNIKSQTSKMLNPSTLKMGDAKMKDVVRAIIASIAVVKPVLYDQDKASNPEELHVMSYDQFCLLTDCLDRVDFFEAEVSLHSDLAHFTAELATRLQRASPTSIYDTSVTGVEKPVKISGILDEDFEERPMSYKLVQTTKRDINTFCIATTEDVTEKTEVIEVNGIPNEVTREVLSLYFEKASKGKVTEEDVELNTHTHKALVYFENTEAVDRVMMKTTHLICQKLLTVKRYCRTRPKDFQCWLMDISDEKSVELKGGQGIDREILEYYFGDEESGGLSVPDIRQHGNRTFLTFKTETEAKQVYQKNPHFLEEKTLEVELFKPKPKYEDRFFISGLKASSKREAVMAFLGREIESAIDISYGKEPGTAIVQVSQSFLMKAVRQLCSVRPLEGAFLHIAYVPISNCILVRGLKRTLSQQGLKLYFQNPKSGNNNKERVVDITMKEEEGSALIYFNKRDVTESIVTKGQHVLSGMSLDVSHYLQGVDILKHKPEWKMTPQPFTIDSLDKDIVSFIKSSKYTAELHKLLLDKKTCYTWDSTGTAVVLENTEKTRFKGDVESWKNDAEATFIPFYLKFWSQRIDVPSHLLWDDVSTRFHTVSRPSTEEFLVNEHEDSCSIVAVGHKDIEEELMSELEGIIRVLDKEQRMDIHQKTETLSNIDPLKLEYLQKSDYVEEIRSSVGVQILEDSIILNGHYNEITAVKKEVETKMCSLASATVPNMTDIQLKLPSDPNLSEYIDDKLKQKRKALIGCWRAEGDNLKIIAQSDTDINEIVTIIKDTLCEQIIAIVPEEFIVLQSEDWEGFKSELCSTPRVSITADSSNLKIYATMEAIYGIVEKVRDFLSERAIYTRGRPFKKGVFKFLTTFCRDKVDEIKTTTNTNIRDITIGFELKGTEGDLNSASSYLRALDKNILHQSCTITTAGSRKIVLSDDGKQYIDGIEQKHRCSILEDVECGSQYQTSQEHVVREVIGEPIIISKVNLPAGKSLYLYRGDITKLKVDLLVNAASTNLAPTRGLSRQIFRDGGPLLREDVEQLVKSNADFRVGSTVVTSGGSLKTCRYVAHAFSPSWAGGKNEEHDRLGDVVVKCLDDTCDYNLASVAIPALSTGTYNFPTKAATKIIVTAVRDYFDDQKNTTNQSHSGTWSVNEIYLCDNNLQKVQAFSEVIGKIFPSAAVHHQSNRAHSPLDEEHVEQVTKLIDAKEDPDSVTLHFYSDNLENIEAAVSALENYCTTSQVKIEIDDKLLKSLDEEQRQKVKDAGLSYDVKVEPQFRLGKVRIRGLAKDVREAESKIQNLLKDERTLRDTLMPEYQWKYYEVMHDGTKNLPDYEQNTNSALERAFSDGHSSFDTSDDESIHHDFERMLRSAVSDPSSVTQIVRSESFKGSHKFEAPVTWVELKSESVTTVEVKKQTEEYAEIERKLFGATEEMENIKTVQRIQCDQMWLNFCSKQRLMSEQNAKSEKVATLWHITTRVNAETLYKLGEQYADSYRQGVQFSTNLDNLLQQDSTPPDADGCRYLLQCRVITGVLIQDMNNTQFLPIDSRRKIRYDSVVIRDMDTDMPVTYKIYNGTQVYPEYIIKFT